MARWEYSGTDKDGTVRHGTLDADSFDEAESQIRIMELTPTRLEQADLEPPVPAPGSQRPSRRGPWAQDAPLLEPVTPRPPDSPREGVSRRKLRRPDDTFMLLFGGIFGAVGLVFTVIGAGVLISGDLGGLLFMWPILFAIGGGYLVRRTLRRVNQRHRVAAHGTPAIAEITELGWQRNLSINGRNPYRMRWRFTVDERVYLGEATTMRPSVAVHDVGDRIWIVHDPDDPNSNVEWPPL